MIAMLFPCFLRHFQTNIIAVQRVFYNQHPNFVCTFDLKMNSISFYLLVFSPNTDQWLLVMSTQLIGFSIAGICKRILVAPASMIWPENLAAAALFNTLHAQDTTDTTRSWHGISRDRFFIYVFIGYFFYSQLSSSFSIFSSS